MVVVVCRCAVFAGPFARAGLPNRRKRRRCRPLRPHHAHLQKNSAAQCVEVNQHLLRLQDKAHKGQDPHRWARCGVQRGCWVLQLCWRSLRAWLTYTLMTHRSRSTPCNLRSRKSQSPRSKPSRFCTIAPGRAEPQGFGDRLARRHLPPTGGPGQKTFSITRTATRRACVVRADSQSVGDCQDIRCKAY